MVQQQAPHAVGKQLESMSKQTHCETTRTTRTSTKAAMCYAKGKQDSHNELAQ